MCTMHMTSWLSVLMQTMWQPVRIILKSWPIITHMGTSRTINKLPWSGKYPASFLKKNWPKCPRVFQCWNMVMVSSFDIYMYMYIHDTHLVWSVVCLVLPFGLYQNTLVIHHIFVVPARPCLCECMPSHNSQIPVNIQQTITIGKEKETGTGVTGTIIMVGSHCLGLVW